jgi:hypothetical protein
MRDELAGRLLARVLGWDAAAFARDGRRLQALAAHKYDEYEGYRAGERFIESLAGWLAQFTTSERPTALDFAMEHLVFISRAELDHLIETVYPDLIRPELVRSVAAITGRPAHRVAELTRLVEFRDLQRKTLILGLADGARLDRLRRASPDLSHEQFYPHPELGSDSRAAMRKSLAAAIEQTGLPEPARFRQVILVDDFAGSGFTLLSRDDVGGWRGKLWKASGWIDELIREEIVDTDARVIVLLYLASDQAVGSLEERLEESGLPWRLLIAQTIRRDLHPIPSAMIDLCKKYFDEAILDQHLAKGDSPPYLGFGGVSLPLVLHHNTPNNSIGLLWVDTTDLESSSRRRALFPRRQRHNPDRP